MARDLRRSAENGDLVFVVAGGCMEPVQENNFIALGMVEDVILSALYKKAAIVLVPLTEGSGSSLKSIEALANGAVMLTTSIGVRGISVSSGTHCVIEDDLRAFPRRIRELLNDPARMNAMRASAREYGAGLDYRRVFTTYGFPEIRSSPDVEPRCADRKDAFLSLLPRARRLNNPETVQFIYAAAGDPGHPVEVTSQPAPVQGAPQQQEVRRLTLRRIVRSIALRIPPVGAFYRRTATKIAELTEVNGQLRTAYENVSQTNAELVKTNAELVKANTELVKANAELVKANAELANANADLAKTQSDLARTNNYMFEALRQFPAGKHATLIGRSIANWEIPAPPDEPALKAALSKNVMARGAACRWCQGSDTILIQPDVSRYGDQTFDAWHCFDCSCRFTSALDLPHVDYDGIGRRHAWFQLHHCDADHVKNILGRGSEYFWAYMAAKYLADVPWFPDRRYRKFLEEILEARIDNRKLRIIEVGCGLGVLGGVAAHLGHDYLGVDVMSEEQSRVADRFSRFGAQYKSITAEWFENPGETASYDLVFSAEVIEHTPKPLEFLRRLISLAKPGGQIILTTPDLDLNLQQVWATDRPPIHTVFLNRKAIRWGLEQLGEPLDATIFNEDGSFDWRHVRPKEGQQSAADVAPALSLQLDPSRNDFAYDARNISFGMPRLDILERPEQLSEHYQEQMLLACLENTRAAAGSMIIRIKRPMA